MNDIKFTKTNGGMGRKAANEDPISGLLMLLPEMSGLWLWLWLWLRLQLWLRLWVELKQRRK